MIMSNKLIDLAYYTPGETTRGHRVWITGKRLFKSKLGPGVGISCHYDEQGKTITIEIAQQSPDKIVGVHKTKQGERPLIDLCNSTVSKIFGEVETVRATFYEGKIILSVHQDDMKKKERIERLAHKLENDLPLAIGTFCSGMGIMDNAIESGLTMAGIKHELAFANEISENYLESSMSNNSIWDDGGVSILGPMQKVDPEIVGEMLTEIIVVGLPCVAASRAGMTKNKISMPEEHPLAGALFFYWLNLVRASNSTLIAFENVVPFSRSASMHVIRTVLKGWGYELHETVLSGNEMGCIEDRERYFMVAVTEGIPFDLEKLVPVRQKEATVGDILEPIPEDSDLWFSKDKFEKRQEKNAKAGRNFKAQYVRPDFERYLTVGKDYNKRRLSEPSIEHPTDDRKVRLLTPVEHARGKGIPVELLDPNMAVGPQHQVLGNSVNYPAVESLGKLIGDELKGWAWNKTLRKTSRRPHRNLSHLNVAVEGSGQMVMGF